MALTFVPMKHAKEMALQYLKQQWDGKYIFIQYNPHTKKCIQITDKYVILGNGEPIRAEPSNINEFADAYYQFRQNVKNQIDFDYDIIKKFKPVTK